MVKTGKRARVRGFATLVLSLFSGLAASARAQSPGEDFELKVRPLLASQCFSCHGKDRQMGGLRLDSRESILKGGDSGPAVNARKPAASLLLKAVSYQHPTLRMPPSGKLTADQLASLGEWVRRGASWPKTAPGPPTAALWSAKPIRRPAVPPSRALSNPAWVRNPIDAFVLAKLDASKMAPAPPASRRQLIRRVTFDLTGLPPTPEEVAAFLNDRDPAAYECVVDRLLASPRYGERWARYWLDLVRYADSNGYERDAEKPFAWRYRDYVIRSLNEDKPFNQFVSEQLAGDELIKWTAQPAKPAQDTQPPDALIATGFLRLGTWDDEPNDALAYKYERLDDLVHTTSSAFLGLTVRCARCHDHKFDPIPQRDYYALAAAFWAGYLDEGDRRWNGGPPPDRIGAPALAFTDRTREAPPLKMLKSGDPRHELEAVEPGFLSLVTEYRQTTEPAPAGSATSQRRLQLARWITDPRNPLTARVIVNRLWQHHFGQGIVRTPNNFGTRGAPPTHPELLDWLASELLNPTTAPVRPHASPRAMLPCPPLRSGPQICNLQFAICNSESPPSLNPPELGRRGASPPELGGRGARGRGASQIEIEKPWRLKRIHRLIVLSNAYRMSSAHPRERDYAQKDFANERLWRFNRQRLDADALRDSTLAVSGDLNLKMGGPGFTPTVSREALEGLSRKGAEWSPSPPDEQRRRTIYMFLKRALLMPLLTVFDFGDTTEPLEQRDVSIVPPQALALMNNQFLHEQSAAFARRVESEAGSDPSKQVELAWRLAFCRAPSTQERAAAAAFLSKASRNDSGSALASLCHVLLNANEFLFVD